MVFLPGVSGHEDHRAAGVGAAPGPAQDDCPGRQIIDDQQAIDRVRPGLNLVGAIQPGGDGLYALSDSGGDDLRRMLQHAYILPRIRVISLAPKTMNSVPQHLAEFPLAHPQPFPNLPDCSRRNCRTLLAHFPPTLPDARQGALFSALTCLYVKTHGKAVS